MPGATVADASLDAQFIAFDQSNPHVFTIFKRFAIEALEAVMRQNRKRIGAKMIWERCRWESEVTTLEPTGQPYVFNNDYVSRYARKLAAEDHRFYDCFQFRALKG